VALVRGILGFDRNSCNSLRFLYVHCVSAIEQCLTDLTAETQRTQRKRKEEHQSNHRRNDLSDAALELAVVGDR
jgi:hypothetical protein